MTNAKLLQKLQKEFGAVNVMILEDVPELDVISSGIPTLDHATGIGGYPRRLVTEIFGPEHVGKSVLAMKAIAEAQKNGLTAVLITTEGIPDVEWAKVHGVNSDELITLFAFTAEDMVEQAKTVSASEEVDLMVIDSIAAVGTTKQIEEGGAKQAYGISGLISQMMTALLPNCWKTNKACLLFNQVRDVANHQGLPIVKSPGGHSLHHGSSMRIQLKAGDKKKAKSGGQDKEIAKQTKGTVIKNKTNEPFREATWWTYHSTPDEPKDFPGRGVDLLESTLTVAILKGIVVNNSGQYICEALNYEQEWAQRGKDKFETWLREDPTRIETIRKELFNGNEN